MAELSREEFYEKYGDVVVSFDSYYKYSFSFTGVTPEGYYISVDYVGDADTIYRYDLAHNETGTVKDIYPYCGVVTDPKTGAEIDSFYDY